jgi:uncharacterized membrane-anchored protein
MAAAAQQSKGDTTMSSAMAAARQVAQVGPVDVRLNDQATLSVPAGVLFIPSPEAGQILAAMGNRASAGLLGLIFSTGQDKSPWFVTASYAPSGHIRDDDAKSWNADDMLDQLQSATDEANKEREAKGVPAIVVQDWIQRPLYDPAAHQLQWSVSSTTKGTPAGADSGINFNTYSLGRDGYVSLNMVSGRNDVEAQRLVVAQLLAGLRFNEGKRYSDFDAATDKVANYGLASLVGGVAATKPGWSSVVADFAAKYWKVLALCAVALAVIGYYFYARRTKPPVKEDTA